MTSKARTLSRVVTGDRLANTIIDAVNTAVIQTNLPAFQGDVTSSAGGNTLTLATSGVTAGSYGNTTAIPVITVDAKGRITAATTNSVSGVTGVTWTQSNNTLTVATSTTDYNAGVTPNKMIAADAAGSNVFINAYSYSVNLSAYTSLELKDDTFADWFKLRMGGYTAFKGNTTHIAVGQSYNGGSPIDFQFYVNGAVSFANTLTVTGAANALSMYVSGGNITSPGLMQLAAGGTKDLVLTPGTGAVVKANGALTVTGTATLADVTISGNLTASGTTTYVNTTNLTIGDNIITLNADLGASAPSENAGIEVNRGTSANVALRWYEATDEWQTTVDGTNYLKVATNTDVSTAYSNAVTYAGTIAATAYSNATTYAATIAATAYSNATSTAATDASTKAATAYSNATTYAATIAGTAYSNAIAYAAANSYVNTQLGLKASLSGATFSGAVSGITTLAAGNTTITGKLDIGGSSSPLLRLIENAQTGNPKIQLLDSANADGTISEGVELWYESSTGHGYLSSIYSTGNLILRTANTARVTISSNGNVGIGNTAPAAALHIQGSSTAKTLTLTNANSWHFYSYSDGNFYLNRGDDNTVMGILQSAPANSLYLTSAGVGLGNTSPSHKLSVNGTAYVAGNTTLAGTLSVSGRSLFGSMYQNSYTGFKDSNASAFTMIEITGLGGSNFIHVEIDHGHAGGGMHGAYRRFALKLNAYTDLNFVEDYEYTYGGGSGYTITRPSTDVVRIAWKGATSYASSFYTSAFIRSTSAFAVSNIGMTSWG